jgi:hypothetical protein
MGAGLAVSFTFIKDAAPMKTVEDPRTRAIENMRKRRICHRGLSLTEGKPSAALTESKCAVKCDMVESS